MFVIILTELVPTVWGVNPARKEQNIVSLKNVILTLSSMLYK